MESIETAKRDNKSYEAANPVDRKRKNGMPVGLKNIGNSKKKIFFCFKILIFYKNLIFKCFFVFFIGSVLF